MGCCFVISLNDAIDRRKHIQHEFNKASLNFEFFDALRPDEGRKTLLNASQHCDLSRLSPGEIACLGSHVALWEELVHGAENYSIIFEDDVFLGEKIAEFLNALSLDLDFVDLVKLETFQEEVLLGSVEKNILNRNLHILKSGHSGTAGYLVTKQGAKKLLEYLFTENQIMPADHYIFEEAKKDKKVQILQVSPALCIQEKVFLAECHLSNSLDQARGDWILVRKKKNIWIRIIRELQRFILRQKIKIFAQKVEFR